jgi:hypothetical protein
MPIAGRHPARDEIPFTLQMHKADVATLAD